MLNALILCAIQLTGVAGNSLRAKAYFDANNVKVGDPMVLTIDFVGEADFANLHPPALAKEIERKDWKLDDASVKTDTDRVARRLTYRVRPMREGVLWFPALEFEYRSPQGERRFVRSNEIPVHAKGGAQVVVEEMGEETDEMPAPPELVRDAAGGGAASAPLGEDELFRWRKALAKPTADAFAAFDFPAARMNEATCALRDGNWARAMKIYRTLEWQVGQTPEIERGIVAALARRFDNPAVELPMWRQVLRPVLRFGWLGRVGVVLGGFGALALLFWLLGRGIRALACVAVAVGLAGTAGAQGSIFREMEAQMNRMHREMEQSMRRGFGFSFGNGARRESVQVVARLSTNKPTLQVGDGFDFVIELDFPKTASVGQIQMSPSSAVGLNFTGEAQNLPDGKSANPSNVVKRLAVPARYDVPFRGPMSFAVGGMVTVRGTTRGWGGFTYSNSFRCETEPVRLEVKPLPAAGQPADFAGIVSSGLRVHEYCDILRLETNDVVTITYKMHPNGYVPDDFLPKGSAFEIGRGRDRRTGEEEIAYRRYFVADGTAKTPELVIPYYDPRTKTYKSAKAGGTPLLYRATAE